MIYIDEERDTTTNVGQVVQPIDYDYPGWSNLVEIDYFIGIASQSMSIAPLGPRM